MKKTFLFLLFLYSGGLLGQTSLQDLQEQRAKVVDEGTKNSYAQRIAIDNKIAAELKEKGYEVAIEVLWTGKAPALQHPTNYSAIKQLAVGEKVKVYELVGQYYLVETKDQQKGLLSTGAFRKASQQFPLDALMELQQAQDLSPFRGNMFPVTND